MNKRLAITLSVLPLAMCWNELVFRLSTTKIISWPGALFTLLFALCWGFAGYYFCAWSASPKVNRCLRAILLALTAVPYMVEYFVFVKFKTLYDLNTVLNGAGDVAGSFLADVLHMVFSVSGLLHILLFLLPFLAYVLLVRRFDPARQVNLTRALMAAVLLIFCRSAVMLCLLASPTEHARYRQEYSFEMAVPSFGLMTSLRLETQKALFGSGKTFVTEPTALPAIETQPAPETTQTSASQPTQPTDASEPETTEPQEPEPTEIDRSPNVLDIDFAALAERSSRTVSQIDAYVAAQIPSDKNEYTGLFAGKNLIFLSAEAFCAEVIDPERTPTLYRLATKGIQFTDFYQPEIAGTTGGEYHNLFGMLATYGGRSVRKGVDNTNPMLLSRQLTELGYWSIAYHNNSYTYYDRDYTHNQMGFSQGFIGMGNGMEEYVQQTWPESDLEMIEGTVDQYLDHQPFYAYYMTVSGHSNYSTHENMMSSINWEYVQDLEASHPVKAYLAANMELEKAMTALVDRLEQAGIADDTVIVLSADHFPYGLDDDGALGSLPYLSELYGYNVVNYLQRDHNRLILWSGCLEEHDPIVIDSPTSSLDILPTLLNLFGLSWDSRLLPGRDVFSQAEPLVFNTVYDFKTELGTYISRTGVFTPVSEDVTIPEGYVERMKTVVRNKVNYCETTLETDYFAHVFSQEE